MITEKVIEVENLTVKYDNDYALKGISLSVYERDFLGIIGPNGGGKSTLLKSLLGLIKPLSGTIKIFGKSLAHSREKSMIGYVPQITVFDKRFPINVFDTVLSGMLGGKFRPFRRFTADERQKAYSLLEKLGIEQICRKQIGELSGGQLQKVIIARALAVNPRIMFLDEPTSSVDVQSKDEIFDFLRELNKDMTIIVVTHDMAALSSYFKNVACLNKTIHYHGEKELSNEVITETFGCNIDLISHGFPHRVFEVHGDEKNV